MYFICTYVISYQLLTVLLYFCILLYVPCCAQLLFVTCVIKKCLIFIWLSIEKSPLLSLFICFCAVHRSVAEKLKAGSHVEPELFTEASVYFSDIVSFTTLASESTPMQVVTMLNDLYLMFDTTIAKFNVYKVRLSDNAHLISLIAHPIVEVRSNEKLCKNINITMPVRPNKRKGTAAAYRNKFRSSKTLCRFI